jgi:hypothetical protein
MNHSLHEDGGPGDPGDPCFCCNRKVALLLRRGATVGRAVEATEMVSLLLCPGTPSNVLFFSASSVVADFVRVG